MDPFRLNPKPRPGCCKVKGCRGRTKSGTSNGQFCRRCREHRYKLTHPYAYSLNKLRNNAKRRGIPFDLSLEEWIMFCDLTGYVDAHGRGAEDLSVDREKDELGYTLSNIRAVTVSVNSRKWHLQQKLTRLQLSREKIAREIYRLQRQRLAA